MVEQAAAGGVDQLEDVVEPVRAAVVGVGHGEVIAGGRRGRTPAAAAPSPRRPRPGRCAGGRAAFSSSIASTRSKRAKSAERNCRAVSVDEEAAGPGLRGGARVGRVADVPAPGARAVDLDASGETRLGDPVAHHPLGGRRAADVAEADEADAQGVSLRPVTPALGTYQRVLTFSRPTTWPAAKGGTGSSEANCAFHAAAPAAVSVIGTLFTRRRVPFTTTLGAVGEMPRSVWRGPP